MFLLLCFHLLSITSQIVSLYAFFFIVIYFLVVPLIQLFHPLLINFSRFLYSTVLPFGTLLASLLFTKNLITIQKPIHSSSFLPSLYMYSLIFFSHLITFLFLFSYHLDILFPSAISSFHTKLFFSPNVICTLVTCHFSSLFLLRFFS